MTLNYVHYDRESEGFVEPIKAATFGSLTLSTGGLTPGNPAGGVPLPILTYENYTHTTDLTGASDLVDIDFVLSKIGNQVTIRIPLITDPTMTAATTFQMVTALPVRFRPDFQTAQPIIVYDNGALETTDWGEVICPATGTITFSRRINLSLAWTAAASGGVGARTVSWLSATQ